MQSHGGKQDTRLKDRWKDQLDKSMGNKRLRLERTQGEAKNRWQVEKRAERSMTVYWERLSRRPM